MATVLRGRLSPSPSLCHLVSKICILSVCTLNAVWRETVASVHGILLQPHHNTGVWSVSKCTGCVMVGEKIIPTLADCRFSPMRRLKKDAVTGKVIPLWQVTPCCGLEGGSSPKQSPTRQVIESLVRGVAVMWVIKFKLKPSLCSIPQSPVSLCKVHHVPCDSSAVDAIPSICVNRSFVWIKLIKPIAYLSWQHHIHLSMIDAVIHVCLVRGTLRVGFTRRNDATRKLKCRPWKFDAYKAWHWYYRKLWLVSFSFFDYCGRNFNNAYTDMTISSKHP